jgi:hypothetical protein
MELILHKGCGISHNHHRSNHPHSSNLKPNGVVALQSVLASVMEVTEIWAWELEVLTIPCTGITESIVSKTTWENLPAVAGTMLAHLLKDGQCPTFQDMTMELLYGVTLCLVSSNHNNTHNNNKEACHLTEECLTKWTVETRLTGADTILRIGMDGLDQMVDRKTVSETVVLEEEWEVAGMKTRT